MFFNPLMYLWDNRVLYLGQMPDDAHHKNPVDVLSICLEGELESSIDKGVTWTKSKSVYWTVNTPHQCRYENKLVAHLLLEPGTKDSVRLKNSMISDKKQYLYDLVNEDSLIQKLLFIYNFKLSAKRSEAILDEIIYPEAPIKINDYVYKFDSRIKEVILFIRKTFKNNFSVEEIAGNVNLSGSRLAHLFKEETKTTLSKYANWLRIKAVIGSIEQEDTLTETAIDQGFVDAAHFSKTFKKSFGLPPSSLLLTKEGSPIIIKKGLCYSEKQDQLNRYN